MTAPNPLVAGPIEQPKSAWAGVWLAEDIELIAHGVQNKSWVDGTLGVVGAGWTRWHWCPTRSARSCSTASPG